MQERMRQSELDFHRKCKALHGYSGLKPFFVSHGEVYSAVKNKSIQTDSRVMCRYLPEGTRSKKVSFLKW